MINPFYLSEDFVNSFSVSFRFRQNSTFPPHSASVSSAVFPVAVWPDFLCPQTCDALRTELAKMTFALRSSDLYEFHQTTDLKRVNPKINPLIDQLCSELYSERFLEVMQRVTGRKLGNHVDISGQRYQKGDFLLCHDDRLEKRRIALILYLIEKDAVMQGGRLFALRSDEEGRPVMDEPQTIAPQWNTLAFFEVTRASFHQVEQVFSEKVPRYSITCWFHDEDEEGGENVAVDDVNSSSKVALENSLSLSNSAVVLI
jgi:prolyl 3-hydroxylase /prolyl 3,4-dihydroxylase